MTPVIIIMIIIIMMTCLRCGGNWNAKVAAPRYCPLCKSPTWNKPRKGERFRADYDKPVIERVYSPIED